MKYFFESLLFAALVSVSTTSLAEGESPDLLAGLPQDSVNKLSKDEANNARGEYYQCNYNPRSPGYGNCIYTEFTYYRGQTYWNGYTIGDYIRSYKPWYSNQTRYVGR